MYYLYYASKSRFTLIKAVLLFKTKLSVSMIVIL